MPNILLTGIQHGQSHLLFYLAFLTSGFDLFENRKTLTIYFNSENTTHLICPKLILNFNLALYQFIIIAHTSFSEYSFN